MPDCDGSWRKVRCADGAGHYHSAMSRLTKTEAIIRVECYLHQACAILREHDMLRRRPSFEMASRSAMNKALKQLLGDELTYLMWVADEEGYQLKRYMMRADAQGKRTDDHVVPLGAIIDHVEARAELYVTTSALKSFLARCLVTAYIPVQISKQKLCGRLRDAMPDEGAAWHTGDVNAIWSRYRAITKPPGMPGSKLVPLPANAGRKCGRLELDVAPA